MDDILRELCRMARSSCLKLYTILKEAHPIALPLTGPKETLFFAPTPFQGFWESSLSSLGFIIFELFEEEIQTMQITDLHEKQRPIHEVQK